MLADTFSKHFLDILRVFPIFSLFLMEKDVATWKNIIKTSGQHAMHPFVGQNTQHSIRNL